MKPQTFAIKIRPLKRTGRICRAVGCMNEGRNAVRTSTLKYFGMPMIGTSYLCDKCCPQENKAVAS